MSRSAPRLEHDGLLGPEFYRRGDVVTVARDLLGKVLCSRLDGIVTRAVITETEAYDGPTDRASHAWNNRRTRRTEPLFADGGLAYVYLCYGIHHLFNVVSNGVGKPHAILVRAGKCYAGLPTMLERRGKEREDRTLMAGPGTFARALGITTALTGESLIGGGRLWIEDRGIDVPARQVKAGPRIGIDYAGEDAKLPYRFVVDPAEIDVG